MNKFCSVDYEDKAKYLRMNNSLRFISSNKFVFMKQRENVEIEELMYKPKESMYAFM